MKNIWLSLIFSLYILSFLPVVAKSQSISCGGNTFILSNFACDSTNTFNNRFVYNSILNNLKESKYEFEIRLYITGVWNSEGMLFQITNDGVKTVMKKKRVFLNKLFYGRGLTPVYKDGEVIANMIVSPDEIINKCSFIDTLIKNDLFTLKSSTMDELKMINGVTPDIDSQLRYVFEIKVGSLLRNFQYTDIFGYEDRISGRRKKIDNLVGTIKRLSSSK